MSALLNQAIASLNLQPGEVFKTKVNGHDVEVRVLPPAPVAPAAEEPSQFAEMVMMDLHLRIPASPAIRVVAARRSERMLPPPYEINESDMVPE